MTRISFTNEDLIILTGHRKGSISYVAQVMLTERVMKSVSDEENKKKADDESEQSTS